MKILVYALALNTVSQLCPAGDWLEAYNVVWNTPSKNASESMPVGGHSIGLNVWVEDGNVLFYAQRSGCFTENNEYHKLGRFRLTLDPNPFNESSAFRQELKLRQGYVEMEAKGVLVHLWAEALRPVIHLDVKSDRKIDAQVTYEGWRNAEEALPMNGTKARFGCFSWDGYPGQVIRYPDVVRHCPEGVLFYHRNREDKLLIDYAVTQQELEAVRHQVVNTQQGRTFGGLLTGDGFMNVGTGDGTYRDTPYKSWRLKSATRRKAHSIRIFTHVDQTETLEDWKSGLQRLRNQQLPDRDAFQRTLAWWDDFWNRSRLVINSDHTDSGAWALGRNYQLFRYQLGCNYYGEYPTKFNGGNFTYDPGLVTGKRPFSPDWRAWGGGSFTAQNQRLIYWPLLKTGDFEAMKPQMEFYRRMLPTGKARAETYWGHGGAVFCEQTENFGLPIACAWGFTEPGAANRRRRPEVEHGVLDNKWIVHHYESQLEFSYMMLEYHRYSGLDISPYMAFIKESIRFFDEHYQMRQRNKSGRPLDDHGKLVIYPSTACETYKGAKNPGDVIAGLKACLNGLLALGPEFVSEEERDYFHNVLKRVPDFSYEEVGGDRIIKPAESWEFVTNSECPQFYPLFPFNRFSLEDEKMITVFRNTWKHGTFPKNMVQSWHQDGIFLARMGMTKEAAEYNARKMRDSRRRFPTFWGPGHDWVPDHNHGGSGMLGLQEMLMQTIGDEIVLFPAWPKDWDVNFKLHAPYNTIIEVELKNGRLGQLRVTPQSREADIINMLQ